MKYVILATNLVLWEVSKVTGLDKLGILIHLLLPCVTLHMSSALLVPSLVDFLFSFLA